MARISGKTLLIVAVLCGVLYWGFFLGGFQTFTMTGGGTATLRIQTNNALTEAVFSPAGASIKCWDKASGSYLGPLSEDGTFDGKWDSAFLVGVGTTVVLKIEDSAHTYYLRQVERLVTAPAAGVDRVSVLEPVMVFPRSAMSRLDVVGTIMTAGVEVDNSTNIAAGQTDMLITLTATSDDAWGCQSWYDYETGLQYYGGLLIFDLTTTTARATITGNFVHHFQMGAHEYWVCHVGQIVNDADIASDGTWSGTFTFNNLAAAADSLDIILTTNCTVADTLAASFGTDDASEGTPTYDEGWIDIHLA